MASTLLAVDDSVTMRKVLEITFASPDFRVVTANSPDAALQKLKTDKPDLVITDGTLDPTTGYDLCKEIKRLSPGTPVLLMSSKQNPFDAAKGGASRVDDHMDKPFDTQQMIDKVKKLLQGQPGAAAKPAASAAQTAPSMASAAAPAPAVAKAPAAAVLPTGAAAIAAATPAMARAKTLIYNPPASPPVTAPTITAPVAAPVAAPAVAKAPAPTPAVAQTPASLAQTRAVNLGATIAGNPPVSEEKHAAAAPLVAHVNGQMAGKLEQLGLTQAQVEAVLAMSREVVERVVWEVVPILAETLIKEELARLTK